MLLSVHYSEYSVNILCKYERKIKVFIFYFFFICVFITACFVCYSMGNVPVEGAITSILKH